jgi:hypothetical protein
MLNDEAHLNYIDSLVRSSVAPLQKLGGGLVMLRKTIDFYSKNQTKPMHSLCGKEAS